MNTLIVDDERLARRRLLRFLAKEPDVIIAGECANVQQAARIASSTPLDLIFLDIEMPNSDVFAFVNSRNGFPAAAIIFVTAYEQYAVRAFEVAAFDYLLKPVEDARFQQTLQRVRSARAVSRPIVPQETRTQLDAVLVPVNGKVMILKTGLIDWIEAEGNYVKLHAGRETYLLRETISIFASKLPVASFVRVHRSTIVNLERVVRFENLFNGDLSVYLKDGQVLRMSRTYRNRVHDLLGHSI